MAPGRLILNRHDTMIPPNKKGENGRDDTVRDKYNCIKKAGASRARGHIVKRLQTMLGKVNPRGFTKSS
jgi:hypothetical protein